MRRSGHRERMRRWSPTWKGAKGGRTEWRTRTSQSKEENKTLMEHSYFLSTGDEFVLLP